MRTAPTAAPLIYIQKRTVFAIDRDLGRKRWQYEASSGVIRVLFVADRVFVLDLDCVLHCIRASDGQPLGTVRVAERSHWGAAMLSHDGGIYVATSEGVVALSLDGELLWRFESDSPGIDSVLPGLALPSQVAQPDKKD
ncbi:MAG: PQQ-like beta-propeller repeat protein [Myxococcales bacterium]|nr:PQQ-like beta-propeller repeat protein [Myxococcales bacterium]